MDPLHELQETTRQPVRNLPTVVRPTRVAVTIAFHPQLRRIGERVILGSEALELSRLRPSFRTAEERAVGPLGDPYLSRTPMLLTPDGDGLVITALRRHTVLLGDHPLIGSARVDGEALRRGALLTIGGRVLLLLHLQGDVATAVRSSGSSARARRSSACARRSR